MEGATRELREHAVGKKLVEVSTSDGWMTLVFEDRAAGAAPIKRVEWSVMLESARVVSVSTRPPRG